MVGFLEATAAPSKGPAELLDAARKAAAANQLDKSPVSGPAGSKNPFADVQRSGVLVGLDVDLGKEGLSGLRPIYLTSQGVYSPKGFGSFGAKTTYVAQLKAKPGYAIGGLKLKQADGVRAVNIIYMKMNGAVLDEKDSYESGWAGNTKVGSEVLIDGHGAPLVGLHGNEDDDKVIGVGIQCVKNPAITARPTTSTAPVAGAAPTPGAETTSEEATDEAAASSTLNAGSLVVPLIMFGLVTVPLLLVGLMFIGKKSSTRQPRPGTPPPWVATGGGGLALEHYEYRMPKQWDPSASNGATKSMTMGMIGLVAWCLPIVGIPLTIYGLTQGLKGLQSERAGMAIFGIILNAIGLIMGIVNAIALAMMAMGKL
jgi:hypothetical protein